MLSASAASSSSSDLLFYVARRTGACSELYTFSSVQFQYAINSRSITDRSAWCNSLSPLAWARARSQLDRALGLVLSSADSPTRPAGRGHHRDRDVSQVIHLAVAVSLLGAVNFSSPLPLTPSGSTWDILSPYFDVWLYPDVHVSEEAVLFQVLSDRMRSDMQSDKQHNQGMHQSVGLPSCAATGSGTSWEPPTAALAPNSGSAGTPGDSPFSTAASPGMSMSNSSPPTPMSHSAGDMQAHHGSSMSHGPPSNVSATDLSQHGSMSSHGPPSNASTSDLQNQQQYGEKLCLVCGDEALGRHFGVLTCEACKSFFRRSVRQSAQYFCRYNRNCAIQKNSRNKCQYCRYQKCVAVGMQIDAVQDVRTPIKPRTDGPQMAPMSQSPLGAMNPQYYPQQAPLMYPNLQWSQPNMQQAPMAPASLPPPPQSPQQAPVMQHGSAVVQMLEQPPPMPIQSPASMGSPRLISLPVLLQAERAWPSEQPIQVVDNNPTAGSFDDVVKSTRDQLYFAIEWAKMVPPFTELPIEDQVIVLKSVWNELLTLRLAFRPSPVEDALVLGTGKLLFRNKGDPEMMRIVGRFLDEIVTPCKMMNLEMAELVCMKALVLFNPDCPKIANRSRVERIQEQCMEMLAEYCRARFPSQKLRFSKILLRLSAVRSITTETRDYLVQRKTKGNISIDSFVLEMLGDA